MMTTRQRPGSQQNRLTIQRSQHRRSGPPGVDGLANRLIAWTCETEINLKEL